MSRRRNSAQTAYGITALIALVVLGVILYFTLEYFALELAFYWMWLGVVNLVTFGFYRFDKLRAQREGAGRVPEIILLALLVGGGVLGGALGMFMRPRHKTRKPIFWIVLGLATLAHIYLLYRWLQLLS